MPILPFAIVGVALYGLFRYFNPSSSDTMTTSISDSISNEANSIMQSITDLFPKAAPYADAINAAQNQYGIPDNILAKLLNTESSFSPAVISGQKRSSTGAVGIAQFMPATANDLGVNPLDPVASIDAAGSYLSTLFAKFGDWPTALAAYNWGMGNVEKKGLKNAPPETVNYVKKIAGVDITQG